MSGNKLKSCGRTTWVEVIIGQWSSMVNERNELKSSGRTHWGAVVNGQWSMSGNRLKSCGRTIWAGCL
jgi:hypothetical protein